MSLFSSLIIAINDFMPDTPMATESYLETKLQSHLEKYGFIVSRQIVKKENRFDLLCRKDNELVCLELKIRADIQDIKQFDTYLPKFRDGFIVVCWQASFSVQEIFKHVAEQSPVPVALIEISKKYGLA